MTDERNNFTYVEGIFKKNGKDSLIKVKTMLNRLGVSDTLYVDNRGFIYLKRSFSKREISPGNFYSNGIEYQVLSHMSEDKLNAPLIKDRIGELEEQFGDGLIQIEVLKNHSSEKPQEVTHKRVYDILPPLNLNKFCLIP